VNTTPDELDRLLGEAVAHQQAGRRAEAKALYHAILRIWPHHPAVNHNLGVIALAEDRIDDALRHLKLAVEADPGAIEAWVGYIEALIRANRRDAAMQVIGLARSRGLDGPPFLLFEGRLGAIAPVSRLTPEQTAKATHHRQLAPFHGESLVTQAEASIDAGHYAEAQSLASQLVHCAPQHPIGWKLLGTALRAQGQNLPALRPLARAIELDASDASVRTELGLALKAAGRHREAESSLLSALEIDPGNADTLNNLGLVAMDSHRLAEAEKRFRAAIRMQPGTAGPHNNLGVLYEKSGRVAEANACFRAALQLAPDFADALNNLAMNLFRSGVFEEAQQCFRRIIAGRPDFLVAYSNFLFSLSFSALHPVQESLAEARRFGGQATTLATSPYMAWAAAKSPGVLRVGLVSADLGEHPVGYFLEGLLAHIDGSRLVLFAYPTHDAGDQLTERLRTRFAAWRPLYGRSDAEAARLIHGDGIHVLIDLSGHTALNRLPVFAWKPAPVQVTWLGYFATTGVAEIDYLLADPVSVPPEHQGHFTETVWYLPDTRLCFTPPQDAPAVAPLPALANGCVTFGSFQNLAKLNDAVLALWARVLAALPDARLRLQNKQFADADIRRQVVQRLQGSGVPPERVSLHGPQPRAAYLAAHGEVDLILDTFPFPGGTTTCEALYMGVPTITLAGDRLIARQGASLLAAAGLNDWVAHSPAQFVEQAIARAGELPALARLRAGLRDQVLASPLFDAPRFARHFEAAVWAMWQRWQGSNG
jgi:protein O-GlcNAc transferase